MKRNVVIYAQGRSGTQILRQVLDQYHNLDDFAEPFAIDSDRSREDLISLYHDIPLQQRRNDPQKWIDTVQAQHRKQMVITCLDGDKGYADSLAMFKMYENIAQHPATTPILLYRSDDLAHFTSVQLTKKYHHYNHVSTNDCTYELDPQHFRMWQAAKIAWYERLWNMQYQHTPLKLNYEKDILNQSIKSLCDKLDLFLQRNGINCFRKPIGQTQWLAKQSTVEHVSQHISNWSEVRHLID